MAEKKTNINVTEGINRIIMEFKLSTPLSKHYTVPPELIES